MDTGICLSESLIVAYEYGMYETGGCVLQVSGYASIWWEQEASDPNLTRFPEHLSMLQKRL